MVMKIWVVWGEFHTLCFFYKNITATVTVTVTVRSKQMKIGNHNQNVFNYIHSQNQVNLFLKI